MVLLEGRYGLYAIRPPAASASAAPPANRSGGLNWKAVALLPFAIDTVVERIVSRVVFTQSLRHPFTRTYPEPLVTMVTRGAFDHFLVQRAAAAGAQVYDNCQVTGLTEQPQNITVCTAGRTWRSRYVAFADGAKGTLR